MKKLYTNIKIIFQTSLFLATLTSVVRGQLCVPETLDCKDVLPTIFKLGDESCDCDSKAHDGALKYFNGKLFVCLNSEWKALRLKEIQKYGSEHNPGSSCKDILEKADGKYLSDGVYWIGIRLSESPLSTSFPVYCDMKSGGWTLVFKAVSHPDQGLENLGAVIDSTWPIEEYNMEALSITNQYRGHYKNRVYLDDNWGSFDASQARVTLYESGNVVKELLFRAKDSQWSSWFHRSWLVNSSWSDLHSEQTNKFTFRGHCVGHGCRYVYINRSFGGCPYDLGWIMYTDLKACAYEHGPLSSAIHYSKLETYAHWGNVDQVGVADVLAIFVI